ncbi:MAG: hypothetical protein Q8Q37_01440 [bacterium]|nr:hypothetical protein [bacterium]
MEPGNTFEHLSLEQDIERLASEAKERSTATTPEARKEAIKTTLRAQTGAPSATQPASRGVAAGANLPNYLSAADVETKLRVEKLVDLAWHKGLSVAIKEAQEGGPLYVDALHDVLTDKLYEEFKKRKLL